MSRKTKGNPAHGSPAVIRPAKGVLVTSAPTVGWVTALRLGDVTGNISAFQADRAGSGPVQGSNDGSSPSSSDNQGHHPRHPGICKSIGSYPRRHPSAAEHHVRIVGVRWRPRWNHSRVRPRSVGPPTGTRCEAIQQATPFPVIPSDQTV